MKKCTTCGITQELKQFTKDSTKKDNLTNTCRTCVKKRKDARQTKPIKRADNIVMDSLHPALKTKLEKIYYNDPIIKQNQEKLKGLKLPVSLKSNFEKEIDKIAFFYYKGYKLKDLMEIFPTNASYETIHRKIIY